MEDKEEMMLHLQKLLLREVSVLKQLLAIGAHMVSSNRKPSRAADSASASAPEADLPEADSGAVRKVRKRWSVCKTNLIYPPNIMLTEQILCYYAEGC